MIKTISLSVAALVLMVLSGCGTGPDTPTGLTVTSTSPITLSWTAVSGATSYNVYRGTASGFSNKTRLASDITGTTYTDTSAVAGTTYYYQVTAVNSDGLSSASNEVNAVSQSGTSGSFVLGGQKNGSQIDLNWSNVANATKYNVYRGTTSSTVSGKTLLSAGTGITGLTFSDTKVTSGSTYYYQVEAINSNGTPFQDSNEASVAF
jgi:fibronectin type 3 domain-containing protein